MVVTFAKLVIGASFWSVILSLFLVAFPVEIWAECPEGTRNNYRGECVPVKTKAPKEDSGQVESAEWIEPSTESGIVETAGNVETTGIAETTTSPSPPRKNRQTETSGPEMGALAEMILATNSELAWPRTPMKTAR